MSCRRALLTAVATLSLGRHICAQANGGCLVGPGFYCVQVTTSAGSGPNTRHWLQAILLFHLESLLPAIQPDSATLRREGEALRAAQRTAGDSGRIYMGAVLGSYLRPVWRTLPRGPEHSDTLFVLGRRFPIPLRDSALVLMIRGDGTGLGTHVTTSFMPATLDDAYWSKQWRSGDTVFTVITRNERQQVILRAALSSVPAIRAFLQSAP